MPRIHTKLGNDLPADGISIYSLQNLVFPSSSVAFTATLVVYAALAAVAVAALAWRRHNYCHRKHGGSCSNAAKTSLGSENRTEQEGLLLAQVPVSTAGLAHRAARGGGAALPYPGSHRITALLAEQLGAGHLGIGLQVLPPQAMSRVLAHHLELQSVSGQPCDGGHAVRLDGSWVEGAGTLDVRHLEWLEASAAGRDPCAVRVQQWGLESLSLRLSLSSLEVWSAGIPGP